ncbi:MAG: pyrroline-5-carboxylate reductase [Treponema sp.]|jgi:pyrroline-5-carboxylate reductase|nr:pyrroline-5-carboxylate reductase [Treponema sp.]
MGSTIACIGSGVMGTALMRGIAGLGETIGFADTDRSKAEAAARSLGAGVYASNTEAADRGDYVFLAVKPQTLLGALREIAGTVQKRVAEGRPPALVSMAPGWPLGRIQAALAGGTPFPPGKAPPAARIMPNTPALVAQGVIALAVSPEFSLEKTRELEGLLASAGMVDLLEESYMDAVTGLSGCGPGFVYLFIEALADGGVRAGLPRDKALRYAVQTVLGSACMVRDTGKHPGELKDMVASPGGATIAGIAALENGAFRGAVMNAVEAACRRSLELGQ